MVVRDDIDALLVLPRVQVQNANAISGPLTWGFPAPSAFAGFAHALNRKIEKHIDLRLSGVGVICHSFDPQIFSPPNEPWRPHVFCLSRNPHATKKGLKYNKDGTLKPPSFVEEGRAHMDVSLVIGLSGESLFDGTFTSENPARGISNDVTAFIEETAYTMRLAGGSIFLMQKPFVNLLPSAESDMRPLTRRISRRLLPGFALISREDLLADHLNQLRQHDPSATSIDALMEMCSLAFEPQGEQESENVQWEIRSKPGWVVPVPVGYGGISEIYAPGEVKNVRDPDTPFRFVESLCTLGQWISPHRVEDIRDLLWHYDAQPDKGLYRLINDNSFHPVNQKEG
jgi:CRISPR-associated protein Csy2